MKIVFVSLVGLPSSDISIIGVPEVHHLGLGIWSLILGEILNFESCSLNSLFFNNVFDLESTNVIP